MQFLQAGDFWAGYYEYVCTWDKDNNLVIKDVKYIKKFKLIYTCFKNVGLKLSFVNW